MVSDIINILIDVIGSVGAWVVANFDLFAVFFVVFFVGCLIYICARAGARGRARG